ncbi:MAG: CvpA family protein [Anaerolineae bacterium]
MFLDALFILLGLLLVVLGVYRRFIGALFLLGGVYVATLVTALSYEEVAYRLLAIGKGAIWFEGLMFIVVYLLVLVIFFVVSLVAFPDTSFSKLHFLDPLLGGALGAVAGAITISLVYRGVGYMISQTWEPFNSYSNIYGMWAGSRLGMIISQLSAPYYYLLYPFFIKVGLPPVLQ